MPEAVWFESRRPGALIGLGIVTDFRFCGWDISDRFEQATIVEPVDPYESGEFHRLGTAPRATPVDHLGLEQAVDGFGERIVVAVTDTADRRLNPGLGQALRIANGDVLGASVRMMDQLARL